MIGSAATFAAVLPGLLVAHTIADHWIQTGYQAACKGLPGWPGHTARAAQWLGGSGAGPGFITFLCEEIGNVPGPGVCVRAV
ncbi:MAG: hypothetical protein ACRDRQ_16915 [Pseudonocardiaceae bacterium]